MTRPGSSRGSLQTRRWRGNSGFTLIELLIAIVLLGGITGAIAAALMTSLAASDSTTKNTARSNDAQIISAFLVRDAQAAGGENPLFGATDTSLGVSKSNYGCGSGTVVVSFKWIDRGGASPVTKVVTYFLVGTGLLRQSCVNSGAPTQTTLANNVSNVSVACDPDASCVSPTKNLEKSVALTITETPTTASASPFTFTLNASLRPDDKSAPQLGANAPAVPLLALGSGTNESCKPALQIGGNAQLTVTGSVVLNSANTTCPEMTVSGNFAQYQASLTQAYGSGTCSQNGTSACPPLTSYATQFADPLAGSAAGCAGNNSANPSADNSGNYLTNTTLPNGLPGLLFPQDLALTNGAPITFDPSPGGIAVYVFCKNVSFSQLNVNAQGVVLYAPNGTFTVGANSTVTVLGVVAKYVVVQSNFTTVTVGPLAITNTSPLPAASVGSAYSLTLNPAGGTPPYNSWSVSSGALPHGLTLGPTGNISGTPDTAGTYNFQVTVRDSSSPVGSASKNFTLVVNPATTTTTVVLSANPSVTGQQVTYTATVTPSGTGSPSGYVEFFDGVTPIAACGGATGRPLTGATATCALTYNSVGTHTITARYLGNSNYNASAVSPSLTHTVNKASGSTSVASSGSPSAPGQAVTYTATVFVTAPGGGAPAGNVEFFDNGTAIATCGGATGQPLGGSTATCTVTYSSVGSHTIKAQYLGDANYASSTSANISQVVNRPSATTVTVNPPSLVSGQTATLSATVTGTGTPTGTVTFSTTINGRNTTLCTGTLSFGQTTCTTTLLTPGGGSPYAVTGSYSGDATFPTSSGTATATVGKASTSVAVVSSLNPSVTGQSVTYTATLTVTAPGSGNPVGNIEFFDGGAAIATCGGSGRSATEWQHGYLFGVPWQHWLPHHYRAVPRRRELQRVRSVAQHHPDGEQSVNVGRRRFLAESIGYRSVGDLHGDPHGHGAWFWEPGRQHRVLRRRSRHRHVRGSGRSATEWQHGYLFGVPWQHWLPHHYRAVPRRRELQRVRSVAQHHPGSEQRQCRWSHLPECAGRRRIGDGCV